jgi:hypothetical protein
LQKAVEQLLRSGYSREKLLDDMEYFVRSLRNRSVEWEKENAALEVLDVLTGWCAPSARL